MNKETSITFNAKSNEDIKTLLKANDSRTLISYAQPLLDEWNKDALPFFVHDGPEKIFSTSCGNPVYERAFSLVKAFQCADQQVYKWQGANTAIKAGDMVRNINPQGIATLHLILSTSATDTSSHGFSICVSSPYPGGVGYGGRKKPAGFQANFT